MVGRALRPAASRSACARRPLPPPNAVVRRPRRASPRASNGPLEVWLVSSDAVAVISSPVAVVELRDRFHRVGSGPMRTVAQGHAFLRERRIVLETGRAAVPSLADAIAGRRING